MLSWRKRVNGLVSAVVALSIAQVGKIGLFVNGSRANIGAFPPSNVMLKSNIAPTERPVVTGKAGVMKIFEAEQGVKDKEDRGDSTVTRTVETSDNPPFDDIAICLGS